MTAAEILGITYGIDINSLDDEYVTTAEKALHSLAAVGNVGSYMGARVQ